MARGLVWVCKDREPEVAPDDKGRIAERFCRLCEKSGLSENYNAVTGEPLRDPAYTWTASVFLLLAESLTDEA